MRGNSSTHFVRAAPVRFAAIAVGFIFVFVFLLLVFRPVPRNSDTATNFLAGMEMGLGNWRLSGWVLPPDNFATTDLLCHAILGRLFGPMPGLMYVVPALLWSAVSIAAVLLATSQLSPHIPPYAPWVAGAAAVVMVAVPIMQDNPWAQNATVTSIHASTIFLILVVVLLVRAIVSPPFRHRRMRVVALVVSTAAGAFADPLMIYFGCVPIMAACVARLRRGPKLRPLLMTIGVITGGTLLGRGLLWWNVHSGGFENNPGAVAALPAFAAFPSLGMNIGMAVQSLFGFFGAPVFGRHLSPSLVEGPWIFVLRIPFVVLLAGVVLSMGRLVVAELVAWPRAPKHKEPLEFVEFLLWIVFMAALVVTIVSNQLSDLASERYFMTAFVIGSIIIARRCAYHPVFGVYTAVCLVASLAYASVGIVQQPRQMITARDQQLIQALRAHGLHHGFAGYWLSGILTVATEGDVQVLALSSHDGGLEPYLWLSNLNWYRSAARDWKGQVFFLVGSPGQSTWLDRNDVEALMGVPAQSFLVDQIRVDVYNIDDQELSRFLP